MANPAVRRATYQDVLDAPPNKVAEIVNGILHVSPRPAKPHALAASALGGELIPPFRRGRGGPGGWFIIDEPELHLDADVVVPDLAGWRRCRSRRAVDYEICRIGASTSSHGISSLRCRAVCDRRPNAYA